VKNGKWGRKKKKDLLPSGTVPKSDQNEKGKGAKKGKRRSALVGEQERWGKEGSHCHVRDDIGVSE